MTFEHVEPHLAGFHFATLDRDERAATEAHLLECRACLAAYLDIKRAIESDDRAPAPSPMSRARLRRAVAGHLRGERALRAWTWWERPLAVGVAAACVALALGTVSALASSEGSMPHGAATLEPRTSGTE